MNRIDFDTYAQFPASVETFKFLQDMMVLQSKLGYVVGRWYILSGCQPQGDGTHSPGVVLWGGEIFEFKGGATKTHVTITTVADDVQVYSQIYEGLYVRKYVEFTDDTVNGSLFSLFTQVPTIEELYGYIQARAMANHLHNDVYEPLITKLSAFNKAFGTGADDVAPGNHNHAGVYAESTHAHTGVYEPAITKQTAFNKSFGNGNEDVARGNVVPYAFLVFKFHNNGNPAQNVLEKVAGSVDISSISIARSSTGTYVLTHNIGHQKYTLTGVSYSGWDILSTVIPGNMTCEMRSITTETVASDGWFLCTLTVYP